MIEAMYSMLKRALHRKTRQLPSAPAKPRSDAIVYGDEAWMNPAVPLGQISVLWRRPYGFTIPPSCRWQLIANQCRAEGKDLLHRQFLAEAHA